MGNALKALWAAGFVANGTGIVEVAAHGRHHKVTVSLDRIAQAPKMVPEVRNDPFVKNGTFVKVHWPDSSGRLRGVADDYFYKRWSADEFVETYASFNPHATFRLNGTVYEPTDPHWQKWRPDEPTSPHWLQSADPPGPHSRLRRRGAARWRENKDRARLRVRIPRAHFHDQTERDHCGLVRCLPSGLG